ncbi:hypothetical protein IAI18_07600 [Acetobacteraceae bacterium H6797]|nr:hypothetical protein [Acetobacteraceae bacterium H6797]
MAQDTMRMEGVHFACTPPATSRRKTFGAALAVLANVPAAVAAASVVPEPDAALLAACRAYHDARARRLACNAASTAAGDDDPVLVAAWERACGAGDAAADRVLLLPPSTPQGLVAKALTVQAVRRDARQPGEVSDDHEHFVDVLLEDLLRLLAGASPRRALP